MVHWAAPSSWHSKVEPSSVAPRTKVASSLATRPDGPDSIDVSGSSVSTTQVRSAGEASTFPAVSRPRTAKVCDPWPRPVRVRGEVHVVHWAAPSRRHSSVPGSEELNVRVADAEATVPDGPRVDRGGGRLGVHGPIALGRRGVHVAHGVLRTDLERVRSLAEAGERARRGARGPLGGAVEAALEGRAALGGGERERGRFAGGKSRRPGIDRGLGSLGVHDPGALGRCGVHVSGGVAGSDARRCAIPVPAPSGCGVRCRWSTHRRRRGGTRACRPRRS